MKLRDKTIRDLLSVLSEYGHAGCTCREFAEKAYANSKHWRTQPRRGAPRTGKIVRSASGQLGRLRKLGYVEHARHLWRITPIGLAFLHGRAPVPSTATNAAPVKAVVPTTAPLWLPEPRAPRGTLFYDGCLDVWASPDGSSFSHWARVMHAPPLEMVPPVVPRIVHEPFAPNGWLVACCGMLWSWHADTGTHVLWSRAS